jgi:hypothetical protein
MYLGSAVFKFYVNGGAAQSITIDRAWFPVDQDGNALTGWVPLNIRFTIAKCKKVDHVVSSPV